MTLQELCKEIISLNETIDELKKVIEIAKIVIYESDGTLNSMFTCISLTDEEEKRLAEKYF